MLNKVAALSGFFAQKIDHPLADARELQRIISELPKDNAYKALDELSGWFDSLGNAPDFSGDRLSEVLVRLEEAAQPFLKRLARDYFQTARLTRSEETRLWSIQHGFWSRLALAYERCLSRIGDKARQGELSKANVPMVSVRLIAAFGHLLKWEQFQYAPVRGEHWRRLGAALLIAEQAGVGGKAVALPGKSGMTTPVQEYQKVMIFQAASLDSLLPLEIEVAERLIAHFLGGFVYTEQALIDSVYWADLTLAQPPLRLARMPAQMSPTLRFIKPGPAHAAMQSLLEGLERGGELPADIDLGGAFPVAVLVTVLRHLTNYLSSSPPQREHDRHRVTHHMSVMHGLVNAFIVFSDDFSGRPSGLPIQSWVVENVSRGGFGAVLNQVPEDWLRVGALVAMQPEGGENWLLGVVRRYHRDGRSEARAGIQALATRVTAIEIVARKSSSYAASAGTPALMLLDGNETDEFRVVLPAATFDPREEVEYVRDGRRFVLSPVAKIENTADYELVRYRQRASS